MAGKTRHFEKFSDRFTKEFTEDEFQKLILRSGCYRDPLPHRNETAKTVEANNTFNLYFTIPDTFVNSAAKHLLIIINGFNEIPKMQLLHWASNWSITSLLRNANATVAEKTAAEASLASVLFPVPFHHWRRPVLGDYQEWDSATMILYDPLRLYLGYRQLLHDIDELLIQFHHPVHDDYGKYFSDDTIVHVMGYSLGGLAALSIFLRDKLEGCNKIRSCYLLSSGVSLRYIDFLEARLPVNVCMKVRHYYNVWYRSGELDPSVALKIRKGERIPGYTFKESGEWKSDLDKYRIDPLSGDNTVSSLFDRIVLGQDITQSDIGARLESTWTNHARDIYYLPSGEDRVLDNSAFDLCTPEGTHHQTLHTIEGGGHFLFRDPCWKNGEGSKAVEAIAATMLKYQ